MKLKGLPVRSKLSAYERQAEKLLQAFESGDAQATRWIRQHHPRLRGRANTNDRNGVTVADIRSAGVTLADAQTVVARWHGFTDWPALSKHIEAIDRKDADVLNFELAVEAIITGKVAKLKSLLRANPSLIHVRSTREHGATLLHYVGANGVEDWRQKSPKNAVKVAEILLKAGAEVDADLDYGPVGRKIYPERSGSTTLGMVATSYHPAAAGVQIPLLKLLLKHGASAEGFPGKWSPLVAALHNGRPEAAVFLARNGARLDLEGAAGVGRLDAVKKFFNRNDTLSARTTRNQMELGFMWACQYGHAGIVEFLLRKDFKVGVQPHGETGLHWAAYGGHADIVKLLLRHKAPLGVVDLRHGGTPLGWALYGWVNPPLENKRGRYHETVALLAGAGAKMEPQWLAGRGLDRKLRKDSRMRAALAGKKQR